MTRINDVDMSELLAIQSFESEEAIASVYTGLEVLSGQFSVAASPVGGYHLYQWHSEFERDLCIEEVMRVPSVRFYLSDSTSKGFQIDLGKDYHTVMQQGMCNVLFCGEEHIGRQYFAAEDSTDITTLAIAADDFKQIAGRYPSVFMADYKRYECGEQFLLSPAQHLCANAAVREVLGQLSRAEALGNASQPYAELKVIELLLLLFTQRDNAITHPQQYCKTPTDRERIAQAAQLITADLLHTPSITELARAVGLNEKKLCYGFKEVYGNTVYGYLFEYKMQRAQQLLVAGGLTISEVAWQCGYEHLSHFSTAFKRRWGVTASEVRS